MIFGQSTWVESFLILSITHKKSPTHYNMLGKQNVLLLLE